MAVVLEIERMTLDEKLRTMEAPWDDLCRREKTVPARRWHQELLDERQHRIEAGAAHFFD